VTSSEHRLSRRPPTVDLRAPWGKTRLVYSLGPVRTLPRQRSGDPPISLIVSRGWPPRLHHKHRTYIIV
jgi:hypothetical protein